MEHYVWISTPMGTMTAVEEDGALIRLDFGKNEPAGAEYGETGLLTETRRQMAEYFSGNRREFTLPLAPRGTAFQMKIFINTTDLCFSALPSRHQQIFSAPSVPSH